MNILLEANRVTKTYAGSKQPALRDVSFRVLEGEFIGIMGASGSGKTTLLNVLSTIDTPTGGEIRLRGTDLSKLNGAASASLRRDGIGFIFQEYLLLDSLTVRENIAVPLTLQKLPPRKIDGLVCDIAERFGIASQLGKYPSELSGGQRQRASAARAIVKRPGILFADEPTGALDSASATELLRALTEANEDMRTAILMVTHDAYAASFAERILMFKDGCIANELHRRGGSRREFYKTIAAEVARLDAARQGGDK